MMNRHEIEEEIIKRIKNKNFFTVVPSPTSRSQNEFVESLSPKQKLQYKNILLANESTQLYRDRQIVEYVLDYFRRMLSNGIFFD